MKKALKVVTIFLCTWSLCTAVHGVKAMAASEGVIELRYGSRYPAGHSYSVADMNWIQKMKRETNGRVRITPYLSGTLIRNVRNMAAVAKGTVDIGFIPPSLSRLALTSRPQP
jgi:TRAP-type C4-dicarboxylate transport system substrate-binding protein